MLVNWVLVSLGDKKVGGDNAIRVVLTADR